MDRAKQNRKNAEKGPQAGSMDELRQMILAKKNQAFGGFLNYMEDKYGDDKSSKKRKKAPAASGAENSKSKKSKQ